MSDEDYICIRYREAADKREQLKILSQTTGLSVQEVAEVLAQRGYAVDMPVKKPKKPREPSKKAIAREAARERMAQKAAKHAEQNARIKEMLEHGVPQTEIAVRMNLSPSAVYYRKMEIYEPERYEEHKKNCYEWQKKNRQASASR